MELKVGSRWKCATCPTELVVVRAPAGADGAQLACGGSVLAPVDPAGGRAVALAAGSDAGVLLGKRYQDGSGDVECLCTKAGAGPLTWMAQEMTIKSTRPLPSSD